MSNQFKAQEIPNWVKLLREAELSGFRIEEPCLEAEYRYWLSRLEEIGCFIEVDFKEEIFGEPSC